MPRSDDAPRPGKTARRRKKGWARVRGPKRNGPPAAAADSRTPRACAAASAAREGAEGDPAGAPPSAAADYSRFRTRRVRRACARRRRGEARNLRARARTGALVVDLANRPSPRTRRLASPSCRRPRKSSGTGSPRSTTRCHAGARSPRCCCGPCRTTLAAASRSFSACPSQERPSCCISKRHQAGRPALPSLLLVLAAHRSLLRSRSRSAARNFVDPTSAW